jgi:ferredoxin
MALRSRAFADNAPGSFFAGRSCIDCGTCYERVGEVFEGADAHARGHRQPRNAAEAHRARLALVASPTASIGTALWAENEPAGGATFTCALPVVEGDDAK